MAAPHFRIKEPARGPGVERDIVGGNAPNARTPPDKPGAIAGRPARFGAPGLAIKSSSFSDLTWCFNANGAVL